MNFAHPYLLLLLWAVVPLLLAVLWGMSRRKRILSGFADGDGLGRLAGEFSPTRRLTGALLLILAAAAGLTALAGPRYGYRWEKVEQRGVDIMVALDCSRSMLAEDIKPSRLTRAKFEIIDLLRMLTGDRVGLVAFAGSAFLQCPLTMDYSAFYLFLDTLSPDMLPVGGTNLGQAVMEAISGFNEKDASDKAVILITDGEQTTGPDPLEAARRAAEKKVRLFCIGVGGEQGAPVPEEAGGFKKDGQGKIVLTRLGEETLRQMAALTGGLYVRSVAGDMDLEMIYQDQIRGTMKETTLESGKKKVWEDRFQWFLALALLCLGTEMLLPRGRRAVAPLLLLILAMVVPTEARAGNVYHDVQQGRAAYESGAYEKALGHFIDAQLADPDNAELYYNIGGAYYKAEQYDQAAGHFQKTLDLAQDNDSLKANAWYNMGNARFRQGDYQKAIEAYQQALTINAEDKEAEENLALAQKALEEKKNEQSRSSDQNQPQQQENGQQQEKGQQQENGQQQTSGKQENNGGSEAEQGHDSSPAGQQGASSDEQSEQPAPQTGAEQVGQDDGQGPPRPQPTAGSDDQARTSGRAGKASPQPDPGDHRLNRLRDIPGAAMMPDYRKREVEQDW